MEDTVESLRADLAEDPPGERSDRARRLLGLTTQNPAVVALMGLKHACQLGGCQLREVCGGCGGTGYIWTSHYVNGPHGGGGGSMMIPCPDCQLRR